ncbi:4241_t:CDS:2 [Ambispora leptoticha]|uniref:4241_t:CDS:1 n=1 Tax=Ambispora leptoticha TaxID=144679 RepID=A0A9N9GTW2_9GLOM|nr:4241_t:CDS:2 [Ambispora leptoticha]
MCLKWVRYRTSHNITWDILSAIPQSPPSVSIILLRGVANGSRVISNIASDVSLTDKIYLWTLQDASLQNASDYSVRVYSGAQVNGYSQTFSIINTQNTTSLGSPSGGNSAASPSSPSNPVSSKPNILNVGPKMQPYISTAFLLIFTVIFASFCSFQ